MEKEVLQIAILIVNLLWGLVLLLLGHLVKNLKTTVDAAASDIKDCNVSISALATDMAVSDERTRNVLNRVDTISARSHDVQNRLLVIETQLKQKRSGGHD